MNYNIEVSFENWLNKFLSEYPFCQNMEDSHAGWRRLLEVRPYSVLQGAETVKYAFEVGNINFILQDQEDAAEESSDSAEEVLQKLRSLQESPVS